MLIDLAKMAKILKFGLANSLLDSPIATWLTLTGTQPCPSTGFRPTEFSVPVRVHIAKLRIITTSSFLLSAVALLGFHLPSVMVHHLFGHIHIMSHTFVYILDSIVTHYILPMIYYSKISELE